tara:strand:+ start:65 stop:190 length:126 start_codon:yes stop_codon:yes gene_type:complete
MNDLMTGGNVTKQTHMEEKIEMAKARIKELELLIKHWQKQK